ncbi:hypothetical protein MMC07_007307 [Pseudocyphellaria aurata]|nr:hypothetical protein [Pseudocyphellaria aurata]
MKAFTISAAVALLAAIAHATPTPAQVNARSSDALIKFDGADADAFFYQSFPLDGQLHPITNPLSVTQIEGDSGAVCTFYGIDGSVTVVKGHVTVPVGPPQTQKNAARKPCAESGDMETLTSGKAATDGATPTTNDLSTAISSQDKQSISPQVFPPALRGSSGSRGDGFGDGVFKLGDEAIASGDGGADTEQEVIDLEALGRTLSGPVYSTFTKGQKQYIVFLVAFGGLFSPLSANIYFPALNALSKDLKVSDELINLTLTTYMIFQGLAPTIFGDLADMAGRRPAYIICFVVYIGANIGLALQNNFAALLVLRCLQSTGSSGTFALGAGVVGDFSTSGERGKYMGLAQFGPMAAPAIAPVMGGILSQFLGWRSIFWFLTILAAVYLILFGVTFPETGRSVVGNGSVPPQGWNMSFLNYMENRKISRNESLSLTVSGEAKKAAQAELASKRKLRCPNPLKAIHIVFEKDVGPLLFYFSLTYTAMYTVMASLPSLYAEIYGFNELQIGLSFIPFGVSCSIASVVVGRLMDLNYKRIAKRAGLTVDVKRGDDMRDFPIELARVQVIWAVLYPGLAAMLCYGWALEREANVAVPLVLLFIIGLSLTGTFNVVTVILVDLYPASPATATAASNLTRCLMGAAGTAVIAQMITTMGRGWCFTFIAALCFLASPMLWIGVKWGPKWREERRLRVEKHLQRKAAAPASSAPVHGDGKTGPR